MRWTWYEDPTRTCAHTRLRSATEEFYSAASVPAEVPAEVPALKCLDCRAVALATDAPVLRVAYRAEPLATRAAPIPEKAPEKTRWKKPSFVPDSWWTGGPRYA